MSWCCVLLPRAARTEQLGAKMMLSFVVEEFVVSRTGTHSYRICCVLLLVVYICRRCWSG